MSPQLLANGNFPLPAVHLLCEAGIDIQTVLDTMPGTSEENALARNDAGTVSLSAGCPTSNKPEFT